ncbi:headcase protein homolog [Oscarella lobularis]|uniref:headcase protein homolog n=1 Tax=Oscarella lobularis TaxID=121494 RepID=UPI0033142BC4
MPYGRGKKRTSSSGADEDDDEETCCKPNGCLFGDRIDASEMYDAVRVVCNNEQCTEGSFMHAACFDTFEQTIVNFLKGIGRARSWSDKQRRQNVWTKKGYDLAYKSCGCNCGKGYLKKDVDYQAPIRRDEDEEATGGDERGGDERGGESDHDVESLPPSRSSRRRRKKGNDKPTLGRFSSSPPMKSPSTARRTQPTLASSPASKNDDEDVWMVATGGRRRVGVGGGGSGGGSSKVGSFQRRKSLKSVQSVMPVRKFNTMQVRVEDDVATPVAGATSACGGGDDLKPLVHETLASHHATTIDCYACARRMTVFDRYPLLDGTFFLSPRCDFAMATATPPSRPPRRQTYELNNGNASLLHAVCVGCLVGRSEIVCRSCLKHWDGSCHQVGGVYSYDIFAASPCCKTRLACNNCQNLVVETPSTLPFFSDFSHRVQCPHCRKNDYHFIKPFEEIFTVQVGN